MSAFCVGFFDLLHPGHIRFLRSATKLFGPLVIGVVDDSNHRLGGITLSAVEAKNQIEKILADLSVGRVEILHMAAVMDWLSRDEKLDTLIIGDPDSLSEFDWFYEIKQLIAGRGGSIQVLSGDVASDLKLSGVSEMTFPPNYGSVETFKHYLESTGCSISDVCREVKAKAASLKVLVVGDLIVDEYVECTVSGLSLEAPIPVMRQKSCSRYVGGAGVVAKHLRAMGCKITFAAAFGRGQVSDECVASLNENGISGFDLADDYAPLLKTRFLCDGHRVFRITRGDDYPQFDKQSFERLLESLEVFDIIFLNDFGGTFRNKELVSKLLAKCNDLGKPVVCDVQARESGHSVLSAPGSFVVMPTEKEARLAMGSSGKGLEELGRSLMSEGNFENLSITLDRDGLLVFEKGRSGSVVYLPALNRDPIDVSGAGDCQLCFFAVSRFVGMGCVESAILSSVAASIAVARLGNNPVLFDRVIDVCEELGL